MGNQRSRPFELFVNLLRDFTLLLFVDDVMKMRFMNYDAFQF